MHTQLQKIMESQLQKINRIHQNKTKLERLCSKLLMEIENNMTFRENSSFSEKNSTSFTISAIKTELKKLESNER